MFASSSGPYISNAHTTRQLKFSLRGINVYIYRVHVMPKPFCPRYLFIVGYYIVAKNLTDTANWLCRKENFSPRFIIANHVAFGK